MDEVYDDMNIDQCDAFLEPQLLEFSWVGLFKGHPQVSLLRNMHTSTEAPESRSHIMRNVSRFCNRNLSVLQGYWVFQRVLLIFFLDSCESVHCESSVNWKFRKWLGSRLTMVSAEPGRWFHPCCIRSEEQKWVLLVTGTGNENLAVVSWWKKSDTVVSFFLVP